MAFWLFQWFSARGHAGTAKVKYLAAEKARIDAEITREQRSLTREMQALTAMLTPPPNVQSRKGAQAP